MASHTYSWNGTFEDEPQDGDTPQFGDDKIRAGKVAIRERFSLEHILYQSGFETNNNQGWHRPGSAVAYYQSAAPTLLPDGATSLGNDVLSKGRLWVDSDNGVLHYWNGTTWTTIDQSGTVPVGSIVAWLPGYFSSDQSSYTRVLTVAANLPVNWKLCDGSAVNNALSPIWNAAGRYLPNLTNSRFLMGFTEPTSGDLRGGAASVTLSTANLPSHAHSFSATSSTQTASHTHSTTIGSHVHDIRAGTPPGAFGSGGGSVGVAYDTDWSGTVDLNYVLSTDLGTKTSGAQSASHQHTVSGTSGSVGSGSAFNILPTYLKAMFIVRIY